MDLQSEIRNFHQLQRLVGERKLEKMAVGVMVHVGVGDCDYIQPMECNQTVFITMLHLAPSEHTSTPYTITYLGTPTVLEIPSPIIPDVF